MDIKNTFQKIADKSLWTNLALMALFVAVMGFGVKWSMDFYTNHGEEVAVPNILHRDFSDAETILDELGLNIEVSDTGYVKTLPPNCILEQSIASGEVVKPGRTIFVTINSPGVPTLALPDVIDNSSYREARVRLMAMGFKVGEPQYVPGEKDWVYGVVGKNGRQFHTGDRISIEEVLVIQVGDGRLNASDSINYVDPEYEYVEESPTDEEAVPQNGEEDDFEVVGPSEAEQGSKSTANP